MLEVESPLKRIECYDISHTQGEDAVGSRVVFIDGKPVPSLYRRFNIKTVDGVDDYASLSEVLERRFKHAWVNGKGGLVEGKDPWTLPDLVVIDGGVGQLGAAIKGMEKASIFPATRQSLPSEEGEIIEEHYVDSIESGLKLVEGTLSRFGAVPICALAKNKEEVFIHGRSTPVNDSPDSAGLLLLRSLRDESHRFALRNHRERRSRSLGLRS